MKKKKTKHCNITPIKALFLDVPFLFHNDGIEDPCIVTVTDLYFITTLL